jgi:hypothetical protein
VHYTKKVGNEFVMIGSDHHRRHAIEGPFKITLVIFLAPYKYGIVRNSSLKPLYSG